MNSGTSEQSRDILCYFGKRHDRVGSFLRRVGQLLKSSEGFLIAQLQHQLMRLDDGEVERCYLVEKGLIGSKPRAIGWLVAQGLPNSGGCLRHARSLLLVSSLAA